MIAARLVEQLAQRGWSVAAAESCTGGMIASALTEVPGSSAVFRYGVVTYANEAKHACSACPPRSSSLTVRSRSHALERCSQVLGSSHRQSSAAP